MKSRSERLHHASLFVDQVTFEIDPGVLHRRLSSNSNVAAACQFEWFAKEYLCPIGVGQWLKVYSLRKHFLVEPEVMKVAKPTSKRNKNQDGPVFINPLVTIWLVRRDT